MHARPPHAPKQAPRHAPKHAKATALVTAATLALALGTATAPAASAWQEPAASGFAGQSVDLTDIVRLQPDSAGAQTAAALTPGAANQKVGALQIALPIKTEATASTAGKQYATWTPGDELTVTLPKGVTFAAIPQVSASGLVDLTQGAAFGSPVTADLKTDAGAPVTLQQPQLSMTIQPDKSAAHILITSSQWGGVSTAAQQAQWLNLQSAAFTPAAATPGFLLTVSGIALTVAAGTVGSVTATVAGLASNGFYGQAQYATYPAVAPAACTVGTAGGTRNASYVGGTTTLAMLPGVAAAVSQPAGQVLMASAALQELPPMTVTGRVAAGVGYQVAGQIVQGGQEKGAILFDFPAHNPPIDYLDALVTPATVTLAPSAGQYGIARTAALTMTAAADETRVTVSGLRIAGYVPTGQMGAKALPAGSTVKLTVAAPAGTNLAVNDAATVGCLTKPGASTFSQVSAPASGQGGSATLKVAATADRLAGLNRYGTAALAAEQFAGDGAVAKIVIANGENAKGGFDALSANYLAGRIGGPILLTAATSLPRQTAQALRQLTDGAGAVTLYVMGKSDSVSDQVVAQAQAIAAAGASGAVTVQRVAGDDRYATSVAAAGIGATGQVSFAGDSPSYSTAILASGTVNADALAAGPLSYSLGLPVLLTGPGTSLPKEVAALITSKKIQQVFVLGGTDRIGAAQLAQLRTLGVKVVKRIAGPNRFATSAQLYSFATAKAATLAAAGGGLGWGTGAGVYIANGVTGFPDALAVGPLAGAAKAMLVTSGPAKLDPEVATLVGKAQSVTALGQPATLADAVLGK